jgi:hypothetical protein
MLALSLTRWSVCDHLVTPETLKGLGSQVQYAFGQSDLKYAAVQETLRQLPVQGEITRIPSAGHRLIVDAAAIVSHWIEHGRFK